MRTDIFSGDEPQALASVESLQASAGYLVPRAGVRHETISEVALVTSEDGLVILRTEVSRVRACT